MGVWVCGMLTLVPGDDDPSVDNYVGGRGRKRQFRGPWYDHEPMTGSEEREEGDKQKRSFKRQYDSGVFLGSDSTDMDDVVGETSAPGSIYANLSLRKWDSSQPGSQNTVRHEPAPEELARNHIELCLETGNETIE